SYVLGNAPDWLRLDNHKYLMGYWSLAFCFACLSERPMKTLAFNARVMIGLCFVLAVVWKLSTPDFVDGTFFQFTLLNDRRLAGVARAVGRVTAEVQQTNRAAYRALLAFDSRSTFAQLGSTPQVAALAAVMTAWTIGLEALIGVGFLVRR